MATTRILGAKELTSQLRRISEINMKPALLLGALVVERQAKILCPVDTGLLRNSITTHAGDEWAIVGTSVEYAKNVELGIDQRPQPFLTTALLSQAQVVKNTIANYFKKKSKEIANG